MKRFGIIALSAALLFGCFGCLSFPAAALAAFSGGFGTAENPYIITTPEQLDAARGYLTAHFKLGNDIDLTRYLEQGGAGYAQWGEVGWDPIGDHSAAYYGEDVLFFSGGFDGDGHRITGLWINRPSESCVGLFGAVNDVSVIRNLGVEIAHGVVGGDYVGGLAGWISTYIADFAVESCDVTGSVSGNDYVGGLFGGGTRWNNSNVWTVTACYASSDIKGRDHVGGLIGASIGDVSGSRAQGNVIGRSCVGGLIGDITGDVSGSYALGNVIGGDYTGGLAGDIAGAVSDSLAAGNVSGDDYVGGLAGDSGSISASSAAGDVSGRDYVGGLAGNSAGGTDSSYAAGTVSGHDYVGGLTGYQAGALEYCFAAGDVSGNDRVGGLAGMAAGSVAGSYATGGVTARNYAGGLTGETTSGIYDSYATGSVSGGNYVGGITGSAYSVSNSFAAGNVSGGDNAGGLSGGAASYLNNYRYQSAAVNGVMPGEGDPNSEVGGVVTAAHIITRNFYELTLGWTFSETEWVWDDRGWIWDERGFPKLGIGDEGYPFPFPGAPVFCVVTFDSRGGSVIAPILNAAPGAPVARPVNDPTRAGYAFTGWYRDYSAEEAWNFGADLVTGDMTLFAGWELSPIVLPTYTVSFNPLGGSETASVVDVRHGAMIARPTDPVREGYTFTGWYRDASASQPWSFSFDTVTGDITLYAGWRERSPGDPVFTVTFDSRGGSAVAPIAGAVSGDMIVRPAEPVREGYFFTGWYRDITSALAWNFDTDTVTGDVTLYAGWRADTGGGSTFTVTFDSRGGSLVAPITGLPAGAKITQPSYPTREGYSFAGWYADAAAAQQWNFNSDVVTGDITLYAKWTGGGGNVGNTGGSGGGCSAVPLSALTALAVLPLFLFKKRA